MGFLDSVRYSYNYIGKQRAPKTINLGNPSMLSYKQYYGFLGAPIAGQTAVGLIPNFTQAIFQPTTQEINALHRAFQKTAAANMLNSTLGKDIISRAMQGYFKNAFSRLGYGLNLLGNLGRVNYVENPMPYLSFLKFLIG
jgi:hypothetical protein